MAKFKETSRRFLIDLDPYNRQLYVSIAENDDRLRDGLSRFMNPSLVDEWMELIGPMSSYQDGRTASILGSGIVLRLREYPTHNRHLAAIAHEVFHVVEFMFHSINLPHNAEISSEAWAYMIGHIHHQIYQNIWPPQGND
ncbi:hypothetical protein GGR92_004804 [Spirosoma lacussanchae]|uniref:hypothetical protein n=1 Tax=Spirosoma lacussanchae TaxID=1884249 RepID=UPI00110885A8|nr:hypothetical protein [Spirosoma lacussanchae]